MIAEGMAVKMSLSGVTSLISKASDKLKNFFTEYYQPYMENTFSEYSKVRHRLTRIRETVSFYDIYVETFLKHRNDKILPSDLSALFQSSRNILVIGNAGSGKTTLIKHLFMQSVEKGFAIPLVITLRKFNRNPISIADFIKNELAEVLAFPDKEKVEEFLSEGNFLILLDGFDELYTENFEKVHDDLNNFCKKYKENYFLMTSRPITSQNAFSTNFKIFEVCGFTFEQIKEFIEKNENDAELASQMIMTFTQMNIENIEHEFLMHQEENYIKYFLENPLLLLMYIMTFRSEPKIPDKKTKFYDNVIRELFENHDIHTKMGFDRPLKSKLTKEQIRKVLDRMSLITFFERRYEFDRAYLYKTLDALKGKLPFTFDNEKVIEDLITSFSLIQEDGTSLSFIHKSIQEFLVANYLVNLRDTEKSKMYMHCLGLLKKDVHSTKHFRDLLEELDEYAYLKFLIFPLLSEYEKNVLFASKGIQKIIRYLLNKEFISFGPGRISYRGSFGPLSIVNIDVGHRVGWQIMKTIDFSQLKNPISHKKIKLEYLVEDNFKEIFDTVKKNSEKLNIAVKELQEELFSVKKECIKKLEIFELESEGENDIFQLIENIQ